MNRIVSIHLNGITFQLEEDGYDRLRAYLDDAKSRLSGNPDREEIITDIESAIAERFKGFLTESRNVVFSHEVDSVLGAMGPIDSGDGNGSDTRNDGGQAETSSDGTIRRKRLYRLKKGAMIAGVCNGLGAYLNIDQTIVRLIFIAALIFFGTGILAYIVLAIVIPEARTPEEIAEATTGSSTAQEFIRRAREGYYDESRRFSDRRARKEWKRKFKREMKDNMRHWKHAYRYRMYEAGPVSGVMFPFASVLHGAMKILLVCAIVSLFATGGLFGKALPHSFPAWAVIVILIVAYHVIVSPLRAMAHAAGRSSGRGLFIAFDHIVKIAVVIALLALLIHYFPELRAAVKNVPTVFHHAVTDVKLWWNS